MLLKKSYTVFYNLIKIFQQILNFFLKNQIIILNVASSHHYDFW